MTETIRQLGCLKDPRDDRDVKLAARAPVPRDYKPREENLDNMLEVPLFVDQRQTSECVGNATARLIETNTVLAGLPHVALSDQHIYTLARLSHTAPGGQLEDTGTHIRSAMHAVTKVGVVRQGDWPLDEDTINKRPPISIEARGLERARGEYWRLSDDPSVRALEVPWIIDTYGEVEIGGGVGYSYMYHAGEKVLQPPHAREVLQGGHARRYNSYRDGGRVLLELHSWWNWGFNYLNKHGTSIRSAAWVSHEWLAHPWMDDLWCFVPAPKLPSRVSP